MEDELHLFKDAPWGNWVRIAASDRYHPLGVWHDVEIVADGAHLQVYVDEVLEIDYLDDDPLTQGSIAFETAEDSLVYIDDVEVTEVR